MMTGRTLLNGRESIISRKRGASPLGCLFFIILLAVVAFVGFKLGQAYWDYFEVRQKTREAMSWAVAGQPKYAGDIVQKVIANASEVGVELTAQNIKVRLTRDTLTLVVAWTRDVVLPFYTLPLKFDIMMTDELRWYKGGLIIK
jgi:hypothetical protein